MAVKSQAAQDFVPIKEVRDGIITLKDGSMCALILASSVNLSLKSQEEQQAIIMGFQTFLNSLDFSLQIVVQSRRLDIKPYLITLEERMKAQVEPLLKVQTKEYIEFIRQFTDEVAIMKKSFVLVVPYGQTQLQANENVLKNVFGKKDDVTKTVQMEFEEQRSQLDQRISVVTQGLGRIGIRTVQLGTEEVVELFYKIFNPGETTQAIRIE
jgi:hypothetical protein